MDNCGSAAVLRQGLLLHLLEIRDWGLNSTLLCLSAAMANPKATKLRTTTTTATAAAAASQSTAKDKARASSLPLSPLQIACISLLCALLISPAAQAATCTSQTFKNNKLYSNCTDLPVLSSYLHWTYDPSNSSLSVVFVAAAPKPDGWVAWAINPTSEKMAGAQTLLARKTTDSTPTVKTYNIIILSSNMIKEFSDQVLLIIQLSFIRGSWPLLNLVMMLAEAQQQPRLQQRPQQQNQAEPRWEFSGSSPKSAEYSGDSEG